jgi:predicted nucleic-acid-binding protein
MIAIDTNVLVRYLLNDDRNQAAAAKKLIDHAAANGQRLFIGMIILVETVWVLESVYGFGREEIIAVLHDMLEFTSFHFERRDCVEDAIGRFIKGHADFSDYLSAAISIQTAGSKLHTFDSHCREGDLFKRL